MSRHPMPDSSKDAGLDLLLALGGARWCWSSPARPCPDGGHSSTCLAVAALFEAYAVGSPGGPEQARLRVVLDVLNEREEQQRKWGQQDHPMPFWITILAEEFGEAAKEVIEIKVDAEAELDEAIIASRYRRLRSEMIQVAAVATQVVECIDRNRLAERPDGGQTIGPQPGHADCGQAGCPTHADKSRSS